jgi:hypothetical protein
MDRAIVIGTHSMNSHDRAVDKYNRTPQVDTLIARLTELCDAGADFSHTSSGQFAYSHIVEMCTRFSECDLALWVHAQCKLNPGEIDRLYSMDMATVDALIAAECPPARRHRIKPTHMVSVSLGQLQERVLAELRLSLHELDHMTKPQMIGYLCTVRPGLLKDWFVQGGVHLNQSLIQTPKHI